LSLLKVSKVKKKSIRTNITKPRD